MRSLIALLVCAAALADAAAAATCAAANRPGATLLIPYFEVDIDDPQGRNTLFSVNNADHDPALAHVILWTDRGLPTLAFDVYLDAHAVQSFSLRQVLVGGRLPATGDASTPLRFPSCATPLALPELDAGALAELRAKHTGRPAPADGLCYGEPREDAGLAVGYVTVDAVRDCSNTAVFPYDPGYFARNDDSGRVAFRNVLWGDVMLVDPGRDAAQGFAAVAREASEEVSFMSFWREYSEGEDHRRGLGEVSRSRFFNGGTFDGGTELLIWNPGVGFEFPVECGTSPFNTRLHFRFTNEAGEVLAEHTEQPVPERVVRRRIGEDLETPSPFGFVEVSGDRMFPVPILPPLEPLPLLVVPLVTAEDRFSAGLMATEVKGSCPTSLEGPPPNLGLTAADRLYEIDLDHGTFRRLPDPGWGPFLALAVAPDHRTFGLVPGDPIASTLLLEVDPQSGETRLADVTSQIARDLAFDPEGRLWLLASTGQELLRVDPESGATLEVLPLAAAIERLLAGEDRLFGWRRDGLDYELHAIDLATGALGFELALDLDGAALMGAAFDRDGDLRLVGSASPIMGVLIQRLYRVDLDPPAGLPIEPVVTFEDLIGPEDPQLVYYGLAIDRSAPARPRGGGARPAASLLVPYFEVDLERPHGRNTLFSVDNVADEPVLAHVVLWTDWGIPSLAFDLFLDARAGRVLDLRRLFADGTVPILDPRARAFPGCAGAPPPAIDTESLAARHTGRPLPADGLCYGAPRDDSLAVGFVTVDVVRGCSAATPSDDGYFGDDGPAGDANVLAGEVFLIDGESDAAQGFAAVAVPASPDPLPTTFYASADDRQPLGCLARTRYFESGVFDGGTELLVWSRASPVGGEPAACEAAPRCPLTLHVSSRGEAGGNVIATTELVSDRQTQRLPVGDPTLPVFRRFGSLDVRTLASPGCDPRRSLPENVQTWVLPLMSARGRFSVGLEATNLAGTCR